MDLNKVYDFFVSKCSDPNNPRELLKDVLSLYNFVYAKAGSVAVNYGNGTHPKHRLTKYHDFFVGNIGVKSSVLDLGSGRGDVTFDMAKKTEGEVVGIEISQHNIDHSKKTYSNKNLNFVRGDICRDVPNKHFDIVVLSNVLEHLKNRVDILKNIVSKTTPDKILLRVPYFEREWTVAMKKELGVPYFLDNTHEIEYTHEEFYSEITDAGLEVSLATFVWGEIWAVCKSLGSK